MDDAGPLSLFVLENYYRMDPSYLSLVALDTPELQLQLDTPELKLEKPEQIIKTKVVEKEYVRFNKKPQEEPSFSWLFSPPTSSTEDLYMVPHWEFCLFKPLNGYKFNFAEGRFLPIKRPYMPSKPSNLHGIVVNLRGDIYYMAHNEYLSFFQCYDPLHDSWKFLKPLPNDFDCNWSGPIVATAVWGDTILFRFAGNGIWAYDVKEDKWYRVQVDDRRCYDIVGEAVVLGETIYALTAGSCDLVLSLSIQKNLIGGDFVFKCSLGPLNYVPDMKPINDQVEEDTYRATLHLVHLGKDNFCLVQSCNLWCASDGYQSIQLTYIKLTGENSRIVDNFIHKVKLQPPAKRRQQFGVSHCFSLLKCKTTGLKEGESFNMDPAVEAFREGEDKDVELDNDSSETDFSEGIAGLVSLFEELNIQKSVESAINEIKVVKLQLEVVAESEATQIKQVEVAKSEPIVKRKKKAPPRSRTWDKRSVPFIFEDARTHKEFADLQGLDEYIRTLRGVDRSSFGKNKFKDDGKVSPSKTISVGDNGGPKKGKKKRPDKVKEQLDFSEEQRNEALQDAEESLEKSSKLEELEVLQDAEESLEKSSKLEELEVQKSVELAIILDCAVNKIKEVEGQMKEVGGENNTLKKEMEDLSEEANRLKVQLNQWTKFADVHSTVDNGNLLNRSQSLGPGKGFAEDGDDDLIRKKNWNVLKKFGMLRKKEDTEKCFEEDGDDDLIRKKNQNVLKRFRISWK